MSMSKNIVSKVKVKPLVDALMVEIRNGNLKTDPRFVYNLVAKSQGAESWKAFANQKNLHSTDQNSIDETHVAVDVLKIELGVMELALIATQGETTRREVFRIAKTKNPLNNGWSTSIEVLSQPSREEAYLEFLKLIAPVPVFSELYNAVSPHAEAFLAEVLEDSPESLVDSYNLTPSSFANVLLLALPNKPICFPRIGADFNEPKLLATISYEHDLISDPNQDKNALLLVFKYSSSKRKIYLANTSLVEDDLKIKRGELKSISQITKGDAKSEIAINFALGFWALRSGMSVEAFPERIEDIPVA